MFMKNLKPFFALFFSEMFAGVGFEVWVWDERFDADGCGLGVVVAV
jgi:hypothetical protein